MNDTELPSVSFNGVAKQLMTGTKTVSGTWPVPDKLAKELGVTPVLTTCDVTGTVGQAGIEVGGTCAANIALGAEPLKFGLSTVDAKIALSNATWTFAASTVVDATFGWAPLAYNFPMTFTLNSDQSSDGASAATDAGGTSTEAVDGDTPATALKQPQSAKFVWPNAFGITGLNLWSLTANFKLNGLSVPAVGFQVINYLDPTKFKGVLSGTDWLFSSLTLSNQQTTPCFAFGFDGTAGNARVNIKDVLLASKFAVGVAKSGCRVGQLNLPAGFSGLVLQSTVGGGQVNLQLQRSGSTTFAGTTSVKNVAISGVSYPNVALTVNVVQDASGNLISSVVQFSGDMSTEIGTFASTVDLSKGTSGLTQSLTVTGGNIVFSSASNGFEIKSIGFSATISSPASGCASWVRPATEYLTNNREQALPCLSR